MTETIKVTIGKMRVEYLVGTTLSVQGPSGVYTIRCVKESEAKSEPPRGLEWTVKVEPVISGSTPRRIAAIRELLNVAPDSLSLGFREARDIIDNAISGAHAKLPPVPLAAAQALKKSLEALGLSVGWSDLLMTREGA